ncbi:MAG: hypothetical protein ABUK01_07900 [Leptospirales bacterium]
MKTLTTNNLTAQLQQPITVLMGFPEVVALNIAISQTPDGQSLLTLSGDIDLFGNICPFTLTYDKTIWQFQLTIAQGITLPFNTADLKEIFGGAELLGNFPATSGFDTIDVSELTLEFNPDSIFPLPMTELNHVEIVAGLQDWKIVEAINLFLTNIRLDFDLSFQKVVDALADPLAPQSPLELTSFSGAIEAGAAIINNGVTELELPTFRAYLPITDEGLLMEMVNEFYDIPTLQNLSPLLGGTDLSLYIPPQLPAIPSLQLSEFTFNLDRDYTGLNFMDFTLGFPQGYAWVLIAGKLQLSDFKLNFDFPAPRLRLGVAMGFGDLAAEFVTLPMVADVEFTESNQFEKLTVELGSLEGTHDLNYSVSSAHISALGFDINSMIPGIDQSEFLVDHFLLEFDANMNLVRTMLSISYPGSLDLIANKFSIVNPDIEVEVHFSAPIKYNGILKADLTIGADQATYIPIELSFDDTDEWVLSLNNDDTGENVALPSITSLASLIGDSTYFDSLPSNFNFEGIELSDFELRFPHPVNQKINHLFFTLEMPARMTIIPSLSVSKLKFHFDADFTIGPTLADMQATLQLNGVVTLALGPETGDLEIPLLITKSLTEWTVEFDLMPGDTVILPFSKLPLLLDNAPISDVLREDLILTDVEVERLELRFPVTFDRLDFASFKGNVTAWEVLPTLQLSLVKFEVDMNIPMPLSLETLWGTFQGQTKVGTLLLPTLRGTLPYQDSGLALEMVEGEYPIPSLTQMKPLLGGFDLSTVLPSQFPAISSLLLTRFLVHFDPEFSGLHYMAFRLVLPPATNPDGTQSDSAWDLFPLVPNTVILKQLEFDFTFPEPHFKLAGIVGLGSSDEFPMTASFSIEDGSFSGLIFELGALDQSDTWSYKIGGADLSLMGFNLTTMLPGLDTLVLALTRFRLEFDNAMSLKQLYFQVHSEGSWDLIANRLSITNLSVDLTIGFPSPYAFEGFVAADFDLHLDSVEKFPILLTIPKTGDWSLALDLPTPDDSVSFAGVTDLSALVGLNLDTFMPPGLSISAFNLTELAMQFPHPSEQKISTVFVGANMPDTWQIVPNLTLGDLNLYTEIDFTQTPAEVTFQVTSVIGVGAVKIPLLISRDPSQWKFGLNPEFETEFFIPFTKMTGWLGTLLPSLPSPISGANIALRELMFTFSGDMANWKNFECRGSLDSSWTPVASLTSFKIDELDFYVQIDATPAEPVLTLEVTGVIILGEIRVPIKIVKTTTEWIFSLNLAPGSDIESVALPFSQLEEWFGQNLIALPTVLTIGDVGISALEIIFSSNMRIWKSFSCDVSLNKTWMLTDTFGLTIKRFTLDMEFPLNATKRKIVAAMHCNILADSQTFGVIVAIDTLNEKWNLTLVPEQNIVISALGPLSHIFNIATLTTQMMPMEVALGDIHLESLSVTLDFDFNILGMLLTGTLDKGQIKVTLPMLEVSDEEDQKSLTASATVNDLKLSQAENLDIILTSNVTLAVTGLPTILQNALPTDVDAIVTASKTEASVTVNNTQSFTLPQIKFANQRVNIKGEFKGIKFTYAVGGPEISTDVTFFLVHEGTHQLNEMMPVDLLNDEVHFRLSINQVDKAKIALTEWPFKLPTVKKLKREGWILFDFGDAGAVTLNLPTFSHNGTSFKANGQVKFPEDGDSIITLKDPVGDAAPVEETYIAKALGIPLGFIKKFLAQSGLSFIGDMLPDSIPLDPDLATVLPGLTGSTTGLPTAFDSYKEITNPRAFDFYIETVSGGSVRFDFATTADENGVREPMKVLLKDPLGVTIMLGVQVSRIAIGETGGVMTFDFDARVDIFFAPLILAMQNMPNLSIPLLPDFKDVHLTFIADKVFGVIAGWPIPIFFNELSVSYLGVEGLELKTVWKNPMPGHGINEIIKVAALLPQFAKFAFNPTYLLPTDPTDPEYPDLGDAQLDFRIEDLYLKTPEYLGGVVLGHQYTDDNPLIELHNTEVFNLLNASKMPTPANLLKVIPSSKRSGSGDISFGPIASNFAWAISNPGEFLAGYSGPLPSESLLVLFGDSDETQPTDDEKSIIVIEGHWGIGNIISSDVMFAMQVGGFDGMALGIAARGSIANDFLGFDIAGSMMFDIPGKSFALDAFLALKLLGTDVATLTVGLSEEEFSLAGTVELFNNPIIQAEGTLTGTIKSTGAFSITGNIDASGGLLSLGGPEVDISATLSNSGATLTGDFTIIDIALLRLKGTIDISLSSQGQLALSGTVETGGGIFAMSEISIEGNSDLAATVSTPPSLIPFQNIKIKAEFSVLDTPFIKLGGSKLTATLTDTSLDFEALISGPQGFIGFSDEGENQMKITGTDIGTSDSKLSIAGDFGINTPLLKIGCHISGTINSTFNLDVTGTITSSIGGFDLTGDNTSVSLTEDSLSITAEWLGSEFTLDAEIDGTNINLKGTAMFTIPFPAPWKIPNPLPGGDDLDLEKLFGLDISISAGVAVEFSNTSYSAGAALTCTFCGVDFTIDANLDIDLSEMNSLDDLKDVIIEFAKSSLSLASFFTDSIWWAQDLIKAVKYSFENSLQENTPTNFTLIKTSLFEIGCDISSSDGSSLTVDVNVSAGGFLQLPDAPKVTFGWTEVTIELEFDSNKTLPPPGMPFSLEGDTTITIGTSGFELSGEMEVKLLGETIFKGAVGSSNLLGNLV